MTTLAGTRSLVRATLHRDRARIVVWVVVVAGLVVVMAAAVLGLYPTQADLDSAAAASVDSAIARAFNGPPLALDTEGGQVAFQVFLYAAIAVALMSLLTMARLTRGEEEGGRLELVRALPVGRRAPLVAALVVTGAMDAVVGVAVGVGLLGIGLPTAGSLMIGAALVAVGLAFTGITAVTAQITENTRVTSGIAGGLLAASFVVRAIGDVGDGAVSWLSPLGWAQKTKPYAGERLAPLLLLVGLAAGSVAVAVRLLDRRDLGAGLVAPRPGPPVADPALGSAPGLALRLQRGGLLWWTAGIVVLGVSYGSIAGSLDDFVDGNDAITDIIARGGGDLLDAYLATSLLVMALVACGFAIQAVLRLRSEEAGGRAENVLATSTSRVSWVRSHAAVAFGGSAVALLAGAVGLGLFAGITDGDLGALGTVVVAALAYVPAVLVVTAIAVALFGVLPRWTALAWVPLAVCSVFGMFGTLLDLPAAVLDISPFELTPRVPAASWDLVPIVVLLVVAAAITAAGTAAFRRRDLTT